MRERYDVPWHFQDSPEPRVLIVQLMERIDSTNVWLQHIDQRLKSGDEMIQWLIKEHAELASVIRPLAVKFETHMARRPPEVQAAPAQPAPAKPSLVAALTGLFTAGKEFVQAVASLKEWIGGAAIVASSLATIQDPTWALRLADGIRLIRAALSG